MANGMRELKVSTPGRICLFGEHQDYLNLPVIASAISLRISIEGHKRDDSKVIIHLPDIHSEESFSLSEPIVYDKERDYLKSVINVLKRHGLKFSKGVEGVVRGEIPINAGTSSSSALIVTWVNFLAQMSDSSKVKLSPELIAQYAYEAEVLEFSEPGGMMDQYSTAIGGSIFLDSYPKIEVRKLDAQLGALVLGNSREPKDTKFILARVKNQIQNVVKELQKSHPDFSLRTISESSIDNYSAELTEEQVELLHGTIRNRDITLRAMKALNEPTLDHRLIGNLMNDHQKVLRDILKISTPKIDRMIEAALIAGAYGAKINGSGGGGCMFAYAPNAPHLVKEAIEKEGGEAYILTVDKGTHSTIMETA
jgi:galactokinase